MKRLFPFLLVSLGLGIFLFFPPQPVSAQTPTPSTAEFCNVSKNPEPFTPGTSAAVTFGMKENCLDPNAEYYIQLTAPQHQGPAYSPAVTEITANSFSFNYDFPTGQDGKWHIKLCKEPDLTGNCTFKVFELDLQLGLTAEQKTPTLEKNTQTTCSVKKGTNITFKATDVIPGMNYHWFNPDCIANTAEKLCSHDIPERAAPGESEISFEVTTDRAPVGPSKICIDYGDIGSGGYAESDKNCISFEVTADEPTNKVSCDDLNKAAPTEAPPLPPCAPSKVIEGPNSTEDKKEFAGCSAIYTGLGFEVSTNPGEFIGDVFGFLLSISGGILVMLIIYSGYQMVTSRGEPEKIQAARERITSAIIGFIFLLFSLVILEVIGVNILHIPNFIGSGSGDHSGDSRELSRANTPINRPAAKTAKLPDPPGTPIPAQPICGTEGHGPCPGLFENNDGCRPGMMLKNGSCQKEAFLKSLRKRFSGLWGTKKPTPTPTPRVIKTPTPTRKPTSPPTLTPTPTPRVIKTPTPTPVARVCAQTGPCTSNADCVKFGCTNHTCVIPPGYPEDALCKPN